MTKQTTQKTPFTPKKVEKLDPKPTAKQSRFMKFLRSSVGKFVGIIIAVVYSIAVITTFQTSIIPGEYLYLSVLLGITVVAFVVYQLMQKKERSVFKKSLLAISAAVILLSSGYIIMFNRTTDAFISNIQSISKQGTGTVITKPYVVYISGIDTYGDVSAVSRSDVNMLAVVNPQTKKILLVNTPRDYYVQLHGTTGVKDKLTHAGIYGIDMSKNTMQDLYETKIDYTVRINFTSLLKIVDALGGIEVQSDQSFSVDGYDFRTGSNTLNSKQALTFSRERHSFTAGDRQRGKNQQKVIEAIFTKAAQPEIILNYQSILSTLGDSFQTNASRQEISSIIRQQLSSAGQWQIQSIGVDGIGATSSTYSMGAQPLYVMEPDQASIDTAIAEIRSSQAIRSDDKN
jgi:LCP family protein required for cell wall assembly